jgi:molybdopterin synthase sulfur carrier subunit
VERDPDAARPDGTPTVTLRYWAAIRAVAGCTEDQFGATNLAALLAAARERHADERRFAPVLAMCSLLVGDRPLGSRDPSEVPLEDGAVVEALPPFAGG